MKSFMESIEYRYLNIYKKAQLLREGREVSITVFPRQFSGRKAPAIAYPSQILEGH